MIVTGDATQIDLPHDVRSGLTDAMQKLSNVRGIAMVELERSDIVRHPLVQNIVDAYETPAQDRDEDQPAAKRRRKDKE